MTRLKFGDFFVSSATLFAVSFIIPYIVIIITEYFVGMRDRNKTQNDNIVTFGKVTVHSRVVTALRIGLYFVFATGITTLLTFIATFTIGRLRPHFLDVCKPEWDDIECKTPHGSPAYVTEYKCLGDSERFGENADRQVEEARKSFLSGHTSISFQSMTFIILYLQARLAFPCSETFILPFLQLCAFCFAFFTALSRVMDNAHHPTDVLAGSILGILVQAVNVFYFLRLFYCDDEDMPKDRQREEEEAMSMIACTTARDSGSTALHD
jgi:phosphatidate phosphatase